MTNKEAIELLDSFRICVAPTLSKAMSVAISALKAQETCNDLATNLQPSKQDADDTISRVAIDAVGLDEEIRCEMCENPMHTDRGCDGNCKYDEILYEKIIQILNKRITPLTSTHLEIIRCKECVYADENYHCDYMTTWNYGDCFCSHAKRRTDG